MKNSSQLGFWGLTGIVFGMMVGAGIYNIPQNMAAGASAGAVLVSWLITAVGMLLLVATFKTLAYRRPDLKAGIYQYARAGWGDYAGFNVAWGYWLCTAFSNIAYAVMLNDSFGAFFPAMINNPWSEVLSGTFFIWLMYFIVCRGIRTAKLMSSALAIIKVAAIVLIVVLLAINIKLGLFTAGFWQVSGDLGGLGDQIKSTMLVTLWCFIGIEGAVMMSSRARRQTDVGKAGVTGFFIAWLLYILVSLMSFGVMNRAALAGLDNPSVAYVLRDACGEWAYYFVIVSVIVSLLGGWVSWTLVCAEVPYGAAGAGVFPRRFLKLNRHGMPAFGLMVSSVIMQLFLVVVVTAHDVYMAALSITGMMILPAYLMSGLYLWKSTVGQRSLGSISARRNMRFRLTGAACTIFCAWMIYAGGLDLFLLTSLFYLPGTGFYLKVLREKNCGTLTLTDRCVLGVISIAAVVSVILLVTGHTSL